MTAKRRLNSDAMAAIFESAQARCESEGMAEAFFKAFKRDYLGLGPTPPASAAMK